MEKSLNYHPGNTEIGISIGLLYVILNPPSIEFANCTYIYIYIYLFIYIWFIYIYMHMYIWYRYHIIEVPPVIIHFRGIFPGIFHPARKGFPVHLRCQRRTKDLAGTCRRLRRSRYVGGVAFPRKNGFEMVMEPEYMVNCS